MFKLYTYYKLCTHMLHDNSNFPTKSTKLHHEHFLPFLS